MQLGLNKIAERLFRTESRQDGSRRRSGAEEAFDEELESSAEETPPDLETDALEDDVEAADLEPTENRSGSRLVRIQARAPNADGKGLKIDVFA